MCPVSEISSTSTSLVYVGTYTGLKSKGVYAFRLDPVTGALISLGLAAESENPSFLVVDPVRARLFVANEVGDYRGGKTGAVSSFEADQVTGRLKLLSQQPSGGEGPCYVALDKEARHLLVANYVSGSVAVLPVSGDGSLGETTSVVQHQGSSIDPERQEGPHAHSINIDPEGNVACAADLGMDELLLYRYDQLTGTLESPAHKVIRTSPGAGPRHMAFHPGGEYLYVVTELSNTLLVFSYENGNATQIQEVSLLPDNYAGDNKAAEVLAHPGGRFVYASNRGHDSIVLFEADPKSGRVVRKEHTRTGGRTPRGFGIDPSGKWLLAANQESDQVVVFRIDQESGQLHSTEHVVDVGSPVCVRFL